MTAACFYLDTENVEAGEFVLSGAEGRHAVTVKRMRVGEEVLISNGRGSLGTGQVAALHGRDRLVVQVRSWRTLPRLSPRLTVAMAVIKGERLERAVEQLSEVGADEVVLFASARAVVRSTDGAVGAPLLAKLRRRAVEAMKQSRRGWLMAVDQVSDTAALAQLIRDSAEPAARGAFALSSPTSAFVLELDEAASPWPAPWPRAAALGAAAQIVVVVGPEGGLAPGELECLKDAGAQVVRLGNSVMRSGTAAVSGAVALSLAVGRWQTDVRE